MHGYPATDIVLIITAIGGLITSIFAALKSYKTREDIKNVVRGQGESSDKLDTIGKHVNGNLTSSKNETEYYASLVEELRSVVSKTTFEQAKNTLDKKLAEVGSRRSSDKEDKE